MLELNLLPWREQRRQAAIRRLQVLLLGVGLTAVLATWVMDFLGRGEQHGQALEQASIHQAIEHFDTQLAQMAQYKDMREQIHSYQQVLDTLHDQRLLLVDLFQQLERAVPLGVQLTTVSRQGSRMQISGVAQSAPLVAQLLRNLSDAYRDTHVHQVKAVDEGEAFEMSVALGAET
ncbi:PilN domain-containing protein [Pseudomonas sp. P66]|jgi:type IV pilus assembly protein PilN|uniref:PilN domain-containing protein n=1 Tax=Pseudomonas arcuscaelestis TaxID=2710591 RepID=A0ABS2BQS7_9PSED|nr:PilN domain-containing protein [Pseudomonas arcuscaelestis]MBM3105038.1 PilN domain-containing protein [Pseudomonas arcuscaelestis]MBM3110909.1 PilN domain-containing protein [Pseudomonas arcuscaelestis]MBM5455985.1 PilN domain-containing protein [Pseudomonas arcuscaelestis]